MRSSATPGRGVATGSSWAMRLAAAARLTAIPDSPAPTGVPRPAANSTLCIDTWGRHGGACCDCRAPRRRTSPADSATAQAVAVEMTAPSADASAAVVAVDSAASPVANALADGTAATPAPLAVASAGSPTSAASPPLAVAMDAARDAFAAGDVATSKAVHDAKATELAQAEEKHGGFGSDFIKSVVFGGIDGTITTFSLVRGGSSSHQCSRCLCIAVEMAPPPRPCRIRHAAVARSGAHRLRQ